MRIELIDLRFEVNVDFFALQAMQEVSLGQLTPVRTYFRLESGSEHAILDGEQLIMKMNVFHLLERLQSVSLAKQMQLF